KWFLRSAGWWRRRRRARIPRSKSKCGCPRMATIAADGTGSCKAGATEDSPERLVTRNWESARSEEHTSELQSLRHIVFRLLLEKKTFLVSMQISISSLQTHNVNRCGRSRHLARK